MSNMIVLNMKITKCYVNVFLFVLAMYPLSFPIDLTRPAVISPVIFVSYLSSICHLMSLRHNPGCNPLITPSHSRTNQNYPPLRLLSIHCWKTKSLSIILIWLRIFSAEDDVTWAAKMCRMHHIFWYRCYSFLSNLWSCHGHGHGQLCRVPEPRPTLIQSNFYAELSKDIASKYIHNCLSMHFLSD